MKKFIPYKPVLLNYNARKNHQKGFTLLETLATMSMGTIILGAGFAAYLQIQENVAKQTINADISQRTRLVFATMGPDLQQTGEKITSRDLPAITLEQDSVTNTSIITVRRGSTLTGLTLCEDIEEDSTDPVSVISSAEGSSVCIGNDGNSDGWPDDVKQWQNQRTAQGGKLRPYILDLTTNEGEFFDYDGEEIEDGTGNAMTPSAGNLPDIVNLTTNNHTWERDYTARQSSIFLFEDRTYKLNNGVLQLIANGETLDLVEDIEKLEVVGIIQDTLNSDEHRCTVIPPVNTADCTPAYTGGFTWNKIKSIEVTVIPKVSDDKKNQLTITDKTALQLTKQFYPRNRNNF